MDNVVTQSVPPNPFCTTSTSLPAISLFPTPFTVPNQSMFSAFPLFHRPDLFFAPRTGQLFPDPKAQNFAALTQSLATQAAAPFVSALSARFQVDQCTEPLKKYRRLENTTALDVDGALCPCCETALKTDLTDHVKDEKKHLEEHFQSFKAKLTIPVIFSPGRTVSPPSPYGSHHSDGAGESAVIEISESRTTPTSQTNADSAEPGLGSVTDRSRDPIRASNERFHKFLEIKDNQKKRMHGKLSVNRFYLGRSETPSAESKQTGSERSGNSSPRVTPLCSEAVEPSSSSSMILSDQKTYPYTCKSCQKHSSLWKIRSLCGHILCADCWSHTLMKDNPVCPMCCCSVSQEELYDALL